MIDVHEDDKVIAAWPGYERGSLLIHALIRNRLDGLRLVALRADETNPGLECLSEAAAELYESFTYGVKAYLDKFD